jgi:TPP-dependent pyruvate/acetoin dehydrogenase alpha subunit
MAATDTEPRLDREHGLRLLRRMLFVRRFEERCVELYSAAEIRGFMHLYIGEEAVAVGVMHALRPEDNIVSRRQYWTFGTVTFGGPRAHSKSILGGGTCLMVW